jgi:hypothetical protein
MNLRVGGTGGFSSEQQRENAKKSNAKQKILRETDPEWVERVYKNMSDGHKRSYAEGRRERIHFYDWTGKKHTEETKNKMSESSKGNGMGSANSQYGTCWITKNGINKKIKKEELETYVSQGWEKGRKLK